MKGVLKANKGGNSKNSGYKGSNEMTLSREIGGQIYYNSITMGSDFDEHEVSLKNKIIKLVILSNGTPADIAPIINAELLDAQFLQGITFLLDQLGGVIPETKSLLLWRNGVPDNTILSILDSMIENATVKGSFIQASNSASKLV